MGHQVERLDSSGGEAKVLEFPEVASQGHGIARDVDDAAGGERAEHGYDRSGTASRWVQDDGVAAGAVTKDLGQGFLYRDGPNGQSLLGLWALGQFAQASGGAGLPFNGQDGATKSQ